MEIISNVLRFLSVQEHEQRVGKKWDHEKDKRRDWKAGETFRLSAPGKNGHQYPFSLCPLFVIESTKSQLGKWLSRI